MEETVDDDVKLQRASLHSIALIKKRIPHLLGEFEQEKQNEYRNMHLGAEVQAVVALLDVFQEEPQLLDPHLKSILPPLATRCSTLIHSERVANGDLTTQGQLSSIASIMYTLCKVRGENVIVRFLDNQPKLLLPVIELLKHCTGTLESPTASQPAAGGNTSSEILGVDENLWKLRYFLLLWAGHLVLMPFDLSSVSEGTSSLTVPMGNESLNNIPKLATSTAKIALAFLNSPSKEQSCAASLLAKLVLRPDMLQTKLLDSLVQWGLKLLSAEHGDQPSIHAYTFVLQFIYALLKSANVQDTNHHFLTIFNTVLHLFGADDAEGFSSVRQSAVARRLALKILRTIMIKLLQSADTTNPNLQAVFQKLVEEMRALEDVVDFMLKRLADRDTQVRYAASKALSVITLSLDSDMGQQVVDAIIGSLGEDVLYEGGTTDLSSVNPLRWHGLTLTLSNMLFRRSPSPSQLNDILNALYLTLTFEQRAATGNSLGTNVRDAANFGLWSLARRYTTAELLNSPQHSSASPKDQDAAPSKIQDVANHLLASACLDSSGNVRRGSSAALQELIGRHPDEIQQGIALVQIVDYQAVGMRRRAIVDVALKASDLDDQYRAVLLEGLFGWRGLQAPDTNSRNFAALSLARLASSLPREQFNGCLKSVTSKLHYLSARDVELRHGLVKALSELVLQQAHPAEGLVSPEEQTQPRIDYQQNRSSDILELWNLFNDNLSISPKDVGGISTRSGLTTESTVSLIYALASFTMLVASKQGESAEEQDFMPSAAALSTLSSCLKSTDGPTLDTIPLACETVCLLLPSKRRIDLIKSWLGDLNNGLKSQRRFGSMFAIASARGTLRINPRQGQALEEVQELEQQTLDTLVCIFDDEDVDARVKAIRCLSTVAYAIARGAPEEAAEQTLFRTFNRALNDYTTNERGDVGSLVRLEAIEGLRRVWSVRPNIANAEAQKCLLSIQRLALERLDKVRLQAARCLDVFDQPRAAHNPENLSDISTYEYFFTKALSVLKDSPQVSKIDHPVSLNDRLDIIIQGFASSTTAGSDTLIPVAQSALYLLLDGLPAIPNPRNPNLPSLLDIASALVSILRSNQSNDRILLPVLEMTVFLFDTGLLHRVTTPAFKPRTLLSLVQKSHFKSTSLPKLLACVHLYRHLSAAPPARLDALRKMTSMLGHAYPNVRVASAEALWAVVVAGDGVDEGGQENNQSAPAALLAARDWVGVSAKEGKAIGEELGRMLGVAQN